TGKELRLRAGQSMQTGGPGDADTCSESEIDVLDMRELLNVSLLDEVQNLPLGAQIQEFQLLAVGHRSGRSVANRSEIDSMVQKTDCQVAIAIPRRSEGDAVVDRQLLSPLADDPQRDLTRECS